MTETTLYFIRHAQSHRYLSKDNADWPLSRLGQEQARELVEVIKPLAIQRLISSPYPRCRDTVGPMAGGQWLTVEIDDGLRERRISFGLLDNFAEVWRDSWDDFDFALPDCESSRDAQTRVVGAVTEIVARNRGHRIGLSTHGNVLGLFLNHIDPAFGRKEADRLTNPDVIRVTADENGFTWDRDFHLPGLAEVATHPGQTPTERD